MARRHKPLARRATFRTMPLFLVRSSSAVALHDGRGSNAPAPQVASEGLIGIVIAQSPEFVAPHGAKKAIFGTNPIAIGVPSEGGPVVMDMATAAYAWFGVLEAKTAGRKIPLGVAQDADGNLTDEPAKVLEGGAIRVFDG